tara:strand:- start:1507 stop:1737 length:231 start_codon:yes stop_codon:yes gene_type:complete
MENQNLANIEFSEQEALKLLVQGVMVAQKRGAFELTEAELISKAVKKFVRFENTPPQQQETPAKPAKPTEGETLTL